MNWSTEEIRALIDAVDSHNNDWLKVSRAMGDWGFDRTPEACRKKFARLEEEDFEEERGEHEEPLIHISFDPNQQVDWKERAMLANSIKEAREKDDPFLKVSEVTIPARDGKPIAVLLSSDWQLGGLSVDYESWLYHIEMLMDMPGVYLFVNGDLISNAYLHRTLVPVWSQVMSPNEQMQLAGSLIKDLVKRGKLLGVTLSEEHDQRDARATGYSTFVEMIKDSGVPLFDNRGILILNVGSVTYVVYCVHRSRFRSILNKLHSPHREHQLGVPANVIITSHTHSPAISMESVYEELHYVMEYLGCRTLLGGHTIFCQTGAYEESKFGKQGFSLNNRPALQFALFHPRRHELGIAKSFEEVGKIIA